MTYVIPSDRTKFTGTRASMILIKVSTYLGDLIIFESGIVKENNFMDTTRQFFISI
jgi:hypothetical protein